MNMTYLKHTLCHLLVAIIGGGVMVSCSQDEPVQELIETYTLSFKITTDGVFSRADDTTWLPQQPDDVEGTVFDRMITSLDLFLLGENNDVTRLYAVESPGSEIGEYLYTCQVNNHTHGVTIDKETGRVSFSGQIMALANMEGIGSSLSTDESWRDSLLPYDMKFGDLRWYIPMWGIQTFENIQLNSSTTTVLDKDIYMLRAVSKIIIKLDESIQSDFEIKSIRMAEGSPLLLNQGYAIPSNAFEVTATEYLNREGCFNQRADATTITTPVFKGNEFNQHTYVSESYTASEPFRFFVTLESRNADRPDISGIVYFSNYESLEHKDPIHNVVRNHIYEFNIKLYELQFRTTVKRWEWGGKVHIDM